MSHRHSLLVLLTIALTLVSASTANHKGFHKKRGQPVARTEQGHLHVTTQAKLPTVTDVSDNDKREFSFAKGPSSIALTVRDRPTHTRRSPDLVNRGLDAEEGKKTGKNPDSSNPSGSSIELDEYVCFQGQLDGQKAEFVIGGGELLAPGKNNEDTPFTAPQKSDTGKTWRYLQASGKVHKGDLTFGNLKLSNVPYGTQDNGPKYTGVFGLSPPGKRQFPTDSGPTLAQALTDNLKISSYSVVNDGTFKLLLGQDPWIQQDSKALMGQVAPLQSVLWAAEVTINGQKVKTDFSPSNRYVYGNAKQVQAIFGKQKPTKRGQDPSNYYDVDCKKGGPPLTFIFGDQNGSGFNVTFSEAATAFEDKESSTGCSSILIGQDPDPDRFEFEWTLGNSFQYHVTPSYHWEDNKAAIKFFSRPQSKYDSQQSEQPEKPKQL
ncbi:unnamed protein product [Sympodiomycopsis kandeliae]